jgi:FlaG/FlaF family flagellin (archaellin)
MSTTDSDVDTGYVTVNASLSGATIDASSTNPLGGYFTHNTANLRFVNNGKITWVVGDAGSSITTVTPTIAAYSASDVGAISTSHAANSISSSHITVLGNTSGTNTGNVCSSNHTGAGYITANQTITLSGDCSGSGTTSISVTVADDSHNHTIANVDNLQTSLDAKAALAGAAFTGDVSVGGNNKFYLDGTWSSGQERYIRGDGASGAKYIRWDYDNNDPCGTNIHDNNSVGIVVNGNNCIFDSSGNVKAAADVYAYTSSDPSLKTNKELIDNPLDKLAMIGGYSYDWKPEAVKQGDHLKGHDYGVMADEIERILPELVVTRDSGTKAVRYDKIIPLLIEAVKELNNKVDNGLE